MVKRQPQPKANRYKNKSGKGKHALAAFLVAILAILVGAYYFFAWHPNQKVQTVLKQDSKATVTVPATVHSNASPPILESVPKSDGPAWEHYTDDTRHEPPKVTTQPQARTQGRAELAIIVDDMGSSLQEVRALTALGVPLTFAVIPGLRHDREVSDYATGQGAEVMLHMPMQSKEYPRRRLESNGLLLSHGEQELKELVESYFVRIPNAIGANNHTGSAFTEDESHMRTVLALLKHKNFFFVDSVTSPATTGIKVATDLRIKSARRDVFLDNEQDETYIRGQLAKAVDRARKTGRAIAICHPHPATIATLAKILPDLQQREGVRLVFASQLVR